jgi:hypothetical protein
MSWKIKTPATSKTVKQKTNKLPANKEKLCEKGLCLEGKTANEAGEETLRLLVASHSQRTKSGPTKLVLNMKELLITLYAICVNVCVSLC